MIENPYLYLASVILLGGGFWWIEMRSSHKIFTWLPAIVLIYLTAILISQTTLLAQNADQNGIYRQTKSWLLPMMLFLMMLRLDLRAFASLGKSLMIAYVSAVVSLTLAFFIVFPLFSFGAEDAGVFGALAGSWTGGTANMLAVSSAMHLSESQLAPALISDALLYTVWVTLLLLLVPFASRFDRWSHASPMPEDVALDALKSINKYHRPLLILLAAAAALLAIRLAPELPFFPTSTWIVLIATLLGVLGSLTPLKRFGGSDRIASFMLYILIALIGSHASLSTLDSIPLYLGAAALILLLHAMFMVAAARLFNLSLFSVGIASLANIGGVASAPILAAAYHKRLVGAAVIMAVMGYLVGTVVGLLIASGLAKVAA